MKFIFISALCIFTEIRALMISYLTYPLDLHKHKNLFWDNIFLYYILRNVRLAYKYCCSVMWL